MSFNRTPDAVEQAILESVRLGISNSQTGRTHGVDESTVRAIRLRCGNHPATEPMIHLDKKVGGFNWRDAIAPIQEMQKLHNNSSNSQSHATVRIGDGNNPVGILCWGDQHIGARGSDYNLFVEMTDTLLNTPNLFAVLTGDVVEWAVKLRGVSEVCAQILDPSRQLMFIESWIADIKHKVIASSFGNHTDDRSEAGIGVCPIRNAIANHVPYFAGIGHLDVQVGDQIYKGAISHKFKGVTAQDSTAGCKRYLRVEAPTFDFAMQGDCHRAGVSVYTEGGMEKVAMSNSTFHLHSGFAARYFSLNTSPAQPVLTLWPNVKRMVPFFSVDQFIATCGRSNGV